MSSALEGKNAKNGNKPRGLLSSSIIETKQPRITMSWDLGLLSSFALERKPKDDNEPSHLLLSSTIEEKNVKNERLVSFSVIEKKNQGRGGASPGSSLSSGTQE